MKIADFPPAAVEALKASLDQYPAGPGGFRLRHKGIDLGRLMARGVLAEARLELYEIDSFLATRGEALDAYFSRLRVLLFDAEVPVGSTGLLRKNSETFEVEHVTLGGAKEIVAGLKDAEDFAESSDSEARLIQIPQIYLTCLALVRNGGAGPFLVLTPPYPEAIAAREPTAFRQFVGQLLEERQTIFPPA